MNDSKTILPVNKPRRLIMNTKDLKTEYKEPSFNIIIKYGQLDLNDNIDGIGRKLYLSPKYAYESQSINGFDEDTYFEEG